MGYSHDRLVKHALVMSDFEVVPSLSQPIYEDNLEGANDSIDFDF